MTQWIKTWRRYDAMPDVHTIQYEELLADPVGAMAGFARFLQVDGAVDEKQLQHIAW